MKKKVAFWDKKNPKKKSKKLTSAQKRAAKARARAKGRRYPNLVDNAAVTKKSKKKQGVTMTLGVYGTTLNDELNRLANGGTYRATGDMVDQALAARQWAAQRSVTLTSSDTVGVLNEIASITSKADYLDFSGVCNFLASTTGLPAAQALRAIST